MDEGKGLNPFFEGLHRGESDEIRALRLALVKERDEARAEIANLHDAMGIYDKAIDSLTAERDANIESRKVAQTVQEGLSAEVRRLEPMRQRAADIERLTRERDEAREEAERLRADAARWQAFLATRPPETHEVICAAIDASRNKTNPK